MSMTANEIIEAAGNKTGDRFTTPDALAVTPDGKIVKDGHPDGRYVLTGPGGSLPLHLAQSLGLDKPADVEPEVLPEPAKKSVPDAPDAKMQKPSENKMQKQATEHTK